MSIDYDVRMVYGFQLNQKKFQEFIKKMEEDSDFDVYDWIEEISEQGNCEIIYENHYDDIDGDYNSVYFGISYYNTITVQGLLDLERDRHDEVCDEIIRIFGSYDILGDSEHYEPELIAVGVMW